MKWDCKSVWERETCGGRELLLASERASLSSVFAGLEGLMISGVAMQVLK